ncbi:hypothetical protein ACWT_3516 [Actinoplanes sp. SE50]|uniref:hypothetical protein n=1 Tax=unclassified Actinoplanes TaxID=2626549 RepID=UPI00023EBD4A|nr:MULTISPECIES: hypothetical protein [unclassified Actinoplanes]AEV84539.1 hypothetical protein ACPL_3644 [Actinoplanes sp. SE50/110]ATO82931.1 hypothetical protein ACWT_3516 [Actinoplanes sp. SE50]SLM00339.1 hypothetical protein ACSP50_3571 [Actinoplanes sp. SE50/110]
MLIALGPILLLWLLMSRAPRTRWIIAAGLAGQAATACLLFHVFPRGVLEISLSVLVLSVATAVTGRLVERRRLGPAKQTRVGVATHLLAGWSLLALLCGGGIARPGPFFPETDGVLPLPEGLHATVRPTHDADCGSGSCTRTITVTGRPGQRGDDLYDELKRHLEKRGWGSGCRPVGWLLDRSTACVELFVAGNEVTIDLSGNRGGR